MPFTLKENNFELTESLVFLPSQLFYHGISSHYHLFSVFVSFVCLLKKIWLLKVKKKTFSYDMSVWILSTASKFVIMRVPKIYAMTKEVTDREGPTWHITQLYYLELLWWGDTQTWIRASAHLCRESSQKGGSLGAVLPRLEAAFSYRVPCFHLQ